MARGDEVLVLDDLSTGRRERIPECVRFIDGTILSKSDLSAAVWDHGNGSTDVIFHLAAWPRILRSVDDCLGTHEVNVTGTLNVFEAAREFGVKQVVYASSSSIYGEQDTHIMSEDMTPNPISPYAIQKQMGEMYAKYFAEKFEMNFVGLRYFNVYGPQMSNEGAYKLVIPIFLQQALEGKPLTIFGDGTQTRAFTYIDDVVDATIKASVLDQSAVLNVGTTEEVTINRIAEIIGGEIDHIIPNPRGKYEEKRKVAVIEKAKSLLNWEPKISIEQGLGKILDQN